MQTRRSPNQQLWFEYNTRPAVTQTRTHYVATESQTEEDVTCIVCLGAFMDPIVCTICQHAYCKGCVVDVLDNHCIRCGNDKFTRYAFSDAAAELNTHGSMYKATAGLNGAASPGMDRPREQYVSPEEALYKSPAAKSTPGYSVVDDTAMPPSANFGHNLSMTCPHCRWHGRKADYNQHLCMGPSQFIQDPGLPRHPNRSSPHRMIAIDTSSSGNLRALQLAECIAAVRNDKLNASAWFFLGECLKIDEDVAVLSSSVTKVGCYTACLHLDKTSERCWRALGMALQPGETCQVAGDLFSRRDCMIRSLMLEDSSPADWTFLGTTLRAGEVIVLPRTSRANFPVHVSALECFRKALTYDSRYAPAYGQLALRLTDGHSIPINGEYVSRLAAARYAIALDGAQWSGWQALGEVLDAGELVVLHDGVEVGKEHCLSMARNLRDNDISPLIPQRFR